MIKNEIEFKKYICLVIWIVLMILVGSTIGIITKTTVDTWYIALNRSPLTPPNYLFGIVWTILYAMIGVSGWLIWQSKHFLELQLIKKLYICQLLLNWSWTPLFFGYQLIGLALICLSMIGALVALLIFKLYNKLRVASLFLVPYLIWVLFAIHLNFYIWKYNFI
jgi:tryptophan-rich sensory protein